MEIDKSKNCHHFNGIKNNCCDAGIFYDDLNQDYKYCIPCVQPHHTDNRPVVKCDLYRISTDHENELKKLRDNSGEFITLIIPLICKIKVEQHDKNWTDIIKCPKCDGKLRVSHTAYNNHVMGRCETKDCLLWME